MSSQPPLPETTIAPHPHQDHFSSSKNTHTTHLSRRTRHTLLLSTSSQFCSSLITSPSQPSPKTLLSTYFTPSFPKITEHGPEWSRSFLPFISKTFSGEEECLEYFRLLGEVLEMRIPSDGFPGLGLGGDAGGEEGWGVDISSSPANLEVTTKLNSVPNSPVETKEGGGEGKEGGVGGGEWGGKGIVTVVGKGVFIAKNTGREWSEKFIYRFSGFDEMGRIGHWEIWADPLSAWVAVGGGGGDVAGLGVGVGVGK